MDQDLVDIDSNLGFSIPGSICVNGKDHGLIACRYLGVEVN